jgi:hypothetical protein
MLAKMQIKCNKGPFGRAGIHTPFPQFRHQPALRRLPCIYKGLYVLLHFSIKIQAT